jgi:hypothetical protein
MKQRQSQSANTAEITPSDAAILHPTGREGTPAADRSEPIEAELGAPPPTQPADRHYDVGSGNEETDDGLDAEAEAIRQAAEEGALDDEDEDIPVFERANRSERI